MHISYNMSCWLRATFRPPTRLRPTQSSPPTIHYKIPFIKRGIKRTHAFIKYLLTPQNDNKINNNSQHLLFIMFRYA